MMEGVGGTLHTGSPLRGAARVALAAAPLALTVALAGVSSACGARSTLFDLDDTTTNAQADAGADANPACIVPQPSQEPAPAYIEIVLDASGSMLDYGKWDAASLALGTLFDEYFSLADESVSLGLLVFSGRGDPTGGAGPYPSAADVPPAFVDAAQYAALHGRISRSSPEGQTPTFPALSGGYAVLHDYVPAARLRAPGRRVLVLVSDGAPTAASAAGDPDVEKEKTVALVGSQLAASPSILTFAIGIGPFPALTSSDYDPVFMSNVAIAGGTRSNPKCDPNSKAPEQLCHFQITTPSDKRTPQDLAGDMLKDLHDLRARTVNVCAFDLTGDFAHFNPARTSVTLTSGGVARLLPADPANGWQYDDPNNPRHIVIKGSACETMLNDASATVAMDFSCNSF
jgi:hypothetical protein